MGPELYFILIYNVPSRQLEIHEFEHDYNAAADAYSKLELEHRKDAAMEVVLVGADSIETIHKTHSHYFAEHADDLFRQFLEGAPGLHIEGRARSQLRNRARRRRELNS
jgi:hypothetical protein